MKKRNLFAELREGFEALANSREGKATLRQHTVEAAAVLDISAKESLALRTHLHLSRGVFARYLRTNPRTLENREQGRAKPNAQATLLIRLVQQYPDTIERLATL
ncbi:helix-turn-helix domain-containing protein [Allopusillimonas ginsengisoli]|uniref:helix-turn-helix domain-containing protein n=1 Tax=Allopusillimonas ginsengisoli TaxID=453575 RepID=UPI0010C1B753|nr:transcriptional regulator [Allopusillimonas ginsengisoli]